MIMDIIFSWSLQCCFSFFASSTLGLGNIVHNSIPKEITFIELGLEGFCVFNSSAILDKL